MSQRKHVMSTSNSDEPGIAYLPVCHSGPNALEELGLVRADTELYSFGYHDDVVFKWRLPEGWRIDEDFHHVGFVHDERDIQRARFWHDSTTWNPLSSFSEVIDVPGSIFTLLLDPATILADTQFALLTPEEVERLVELLEACAAGQLERRIWVSKINEPAAASLRLAEILPILGAATPDSQP